MRACLYASPAAPSGPPIPTPKSFFNFSEHLRSNLACSSESGVCALPSLRVLVYTLPSHNLPAPFYPYFLPTIPTPPYLTHIPTSLRPHAGPHVPSGHLPRHRRLHRQPSH